MIILKSIFLLLFCSIFTFAQSPYNLEIERRVEDSTLILDVYIKKIAGSDFALGSSNFDLMVESSNLDLSKSVFLPGDFDSNTDPSSYDAMGIGVNKIIAMNVRSSARGTGTGKMVTETKSKIGSLEIPITNPCATVSPTWVMTSAAIHSYFKTSIGNEISKEAIYINPSSIDLDGGLSKTIPAISFQNGKLVSSSLTGNQWYLDGMPIPGAKSNEIVPIVQGNYTVEVTYPCAKNISQAFPLTITGTGIGDFVISYNYLAQPNPFIGESEIVYNLPNAANIKLELYDLTGVQLLDLDNGQKSQGRHVFLFKPSKYNLADGVYVAKLSVGDRTGTLKLVAQK